MGPAGGSVWAVPSLCGLLLAPPALRCGANSCTAAKRRARNFAERALRNIGSRLPRHSGLMLAARITLPHFSGSSAKHLAKSVRHRHRHGAELGDPRLDRGIGEARVDLFVKGPLLFPSK